MLVWAWLQSIVTCVTLDEVKVFRVKSSLNWIVTPNNTEHRIIRLIKIYKICSIITNNVLPDGRVTLCVAISSNCWSCVIFVIPTQITELPRWLLFSTRVMTFCWHLEQPKGYQLNSSPRLEQPNTSLVIHRDVGHTWRITFTDMMA